MGINTIVLIHNDCLTEIGEDEAFAPDLVEAIQQGPAERQRYVGAGNTSNAAHIVSMAHSSYEYFVRVHGNGATMVTYDADQATLDAMAAFLTDKGYQVTKPETA